MTVCVFAGPTLAADSIAAMLPADCLGPAGHGDVYRATLRRPRPRIIGLIDGYFRHLPAVRHKEILWAMSQGIHVFGSASMGALRAAELADFGMVGIGQVYEQFRAGVLEDDDEVAVDHGPADVNYAPVSEAMVDIRATLRAARAAGIIGQAVHDRLLAEAKRLHFSRRSYAAIVDTTCATIGAEVELRALTAWLETGRVHRKRADAVAMIEAIRDFLATDPPPLVPQFRFQYTEAWAADMGAAALAGSAASDDSDLLSREDLLDELRLDPAAYQDVRQAALLRALALREAERRGAAVAEATISDAVRRWTLERHSGAQFDPRAWQQANHLDDESLRAFIADEERQRRVLELASPLAERYLLDAARACGRFADLAKRGLAKRQQLEAAGHSVATLEDAGLPASELVAWFAERKLNRPIPADVEGFSAALGFPDLGRFYRALLREYLYTGSR